MAGSLSDLPKYTPSQVTRALKADCQPYMDLAAAYSSDPASKLEETAAKHQQLFDNVSVLLFKNLRLDLPALDGHTLLHCSNRTAVELALK